MSNDAETSYLFPSRLLRFVLIFTSQVGIMHLIEEQWGGIFRFTN